MSLASYTHLSAFDLDHTLLTVNSAHDFALFLFRRGVLSLRELSYILFSYVRHKLLDLSIADLHHKVFSRIFKGRRLDRFNAHLLVYQEERRDTLFYPPAHHRLLDAQKKGHYTVIISSSADFVVRPFAQRLGVDAFFTTEYALDAEGRVSSIQRLVRGNEKADILRTLACELSLELEQVTAYSDSHLDLPFLEAAGRAVGVQPDRRLRAVCRQRQWEMI